VAGRRCLRPQGTAARAVSAWPPPAVL